MRPELQSAITLARTLPPDKLTALIGQLAEIDAIALARLTAPVTPSASASNKLREVPEGSHQPPRISTIRTPPWLGLPMERANGNPPSQNRRAKPIHAG
jgi:hypothetical protein